MEPSIYLVDPDELEDKPKRLRREERREDGGPLKN
jgi:hypothetical protein